MPSRSSRRVLLAVLFSLVAATAPMTVSAKQATGCTSGTGMVFSANPIASGGSQGLTDRKDADYPELNSERVSVDLIGLDGSGYLRGTWATIVSETGNAAYETDCTYDYTRHDDRFEQVMAYYWTTTSQLYLRSLGFGVTAGWPAINADQQRVRINQWGVDNSFATDHPKDEMRFGKGGVDDAEDGEIILHELGHQIHFSQSADFYATEESSAISEGFGDYWAATVSEWATGGTLDPECIGDWDAVSYTDAPHCLRRLDAGLTYPDDLNHRIHHDGTIWSQALWDLRAAIGATHADKAILWAQFNWVGTDMPDLAELIVAEADNRFGQGAAACAAFEDRGILSCD
jgi:hypothetical protein